MYLWVGWLCCCPGIVWELIRRRAHTQLIRKHSVTVFWARWATVGWSWPKEWNWCARSNLQFKKKRRWGMNCRTFSQNPGTRGKRHQHQWLVFSTSFSSAQSRVWPNPSLEYPTGICSGSSYLGSLQAGAQFCAYLGTTGSGGRGPGGGGLR